MTLPLFLVAVALVIVVPWRYPWDWPALGLVLGVWIGQWWDGRQRSQLGDDSWRGGGEPGVPSGSTRRSSGQPRPSGPLGPDGVLVVVDRSGWAHVFRSTDQLLRHVEEVDADLEAYDVFTLDGRAVRLVADREHAVVVVVTETEDPDALLRAVHRAAAAMDLPPHLRDAALLANHVQLRRWEGRCPRGPQWLHRLVHGAPPPSLA